jgi:membrane fusion protein (multidrug efflux system)
MAVTFSHSLRSLKADGFRRSVIGLVLAVVVLGSWVGWSLFARVTLYEVSDTARLEISQEVHPIQAPTAGRVVTTRLILGAAVDAGEILVELDTEAERYRVQEERTSLVALSAQPDVVRKEVSAAEQAGREDQRAAQAALEEIRVRAQGAKEAVWFAEEEVRRFVLLHTRGFIAELDVLHARDEAQKRRTTADTLHLEVKRLEKDLQTKKNDRTALLERLNREISRIKGQMTTAQETIARLAYDEEKRRIRAPIAGRLGEVAPLRVGAFVPAGERLGAVVPQGELRAVAHFLPSLALGRIQLGQLAQMRLYGFPWTQYGTLAATVASVASEIRDGQVRVVITIHPDPASSISLQQGLPGTIEIAVDRVSPATLLLRLAGKRLDKPTLKPESQKVRSEHQ